MSEVPTQAEVVEVIAQVLRDELCFDGALLPEAELQRDLAVDSLAAFTLVVALEDRFLVTLPEDAAGEVRTVADLAALVVRQAQAETREGSAA